MTVMDELDALRADVPGCRVIVLADLVSRMVFCASSTERLPQEKYDAICESGANLFKSPALAASLVALGQKKSGGGEIVEFGPEGITVFLNCLEMGDEALCIQCNAGVDLDRLLSLARPVLESIGGPQE